MLMRIFHHHIVESRKYLTLFDTKRIDGTLNVNRQDIRAHVEWYSCTAIKANSVDKSCRKKKRNVQK